MADPTQYTFPLNEVAEALIKQQGIHEGRWLLGLDLSFAATTMGPSPNTSLPTGIVQVGGVTMSRAPKDLSDDQAGLVDAAKVNPKPA